MTATAGATATATASVSMQGSLMASGLRGILRISRVDVGVTLTSQGPRVEPPAGLQAQQEGHARWVILSPDFIRLRIQRALISQVPAERRLWVRPVSQARRY